MASISPQNKQRLADAHRRSPSGDVKQFKEFRERTRQDSRVCPKSVQILGGPWKVVRERLFHAGLHLILDCLHLRFERLFLDTCGCFDVEMVFFLLVDL